MVRRHSVCQHLCRSDMRTALLQANTISRVQIYHRLCFELFFPHSASGKHKYNTQLFRKKALEPNTPKVLFAFYMFLHVITHFVLLYRFWTHGNKRSVACFYGREQAHRPFSVGLGLMKLLWSVRKAEMDTTLIAQAESGQLSFTFRSTCQYTHIYECVCPKFLSKTLHWAVQQIWALISHTHIW